jgi:hypothetical protein
VKSGGLVETPIITLILHPIRYASKWTGDLASSPPAEV